MGTPAGARCLTRLVRACPAATRPGTDSLAETCPGKTGPRKTCPGARPGKTRPTTTPGDHTPST
ncbi:hypothetical protein [Nonomuraea gerenzanensis]|uniref:hypothetical protein n=1 Tax=Nonomuraea gerenzanensis TaxID=93944 RepID=UPI001CD9B5FF|nr:hypothetical protein [Nonomuraea gerenzanensis]UBU15190.1 hypothetical protein LCN96_09230 [Nonomuraea gerenzanensis]